MLWEIGDVGESMENELLFQRCINFNDLPLWQKRGIGFYWEMFDRNGADRRRLKIDMNLPMVTLMVSLLDTNFLIKSVS